MSENKKSNKRARFPNWSAIETSFLLMGKNFDGWMFWPPLWKIWLDVNIISSETSHSISAKLKNLQKQKGIYPEALNSLYTHYNAA